MLLAQLPQAWLFGLGGGLMIGLAAAMLLLFNARILGASGILGGLVDGTDPGNFTERSVFIGGLVGAPALAVAWFGAPVIHVSGDLPMLIGAGLLVGFGSRLANGCTSGHGVCGMARFSSRSIVATLVYIAAGMATFFVARHVLGVL